MTPTAHSTQRRYMAEPQARPPRDPERRAALFRHLAFVIAQVAAAVPLADLPPNDLPPKAKKRLLEEAWRTHFRDRFNSGRSAAELEDEPLRSYIYDIEIHAVEVLGVTFDERPEQ